MESTKVGNKDARQVHIKCNILYFVPTTRLCKEGLQNVYLQAGLWSEVVASLLYEITYTAIPMTAKLSHTPYQNKRLRS
jgi:hypothetical protein